MVRGTRDKAQGDKAVTKPADTNSKIDSGDGELRLDSTARENINCVSYISTPKSAESIIISETVCALEFFLLGV
jgi:hypothetical protein